ncbi:MAG: BamA/TamA family outer membrane protein [Candidatus Atribacteria bacterium]
MGKIKAKVKILFSQYCKYFFMVVLLGIIISTAISSLSPEKTMARPRYDPNLEWQVLESPHFSVYFHLINEDFNNSNNNSYNININCLAQEIADIAEKVYYKVNAQLGPPKHHHLQKIAIIIEDFSDYALGFSSSFPHRVIRLSLTPPTAKSFDMKFKSWLKIVIIHEYTHLAHFEMTGGLTTALRALLGQIITPNALQPTWSTEGLAVYNETKFSTGGRGTDSRYDMYLRMAALEDQFNTLDQINGYYLTSWPGGTAPYIYGQSLIHFIAQKYGEDKVIALSEIFCRYPYSGMNYALKKTIGLNSAELYQNWKDHLKDKYQSQAQKIISLKSITTSKQLTKYNYWVDYPHWISTPNGDRIAVRVSTPHYYPFIQIIDPLSPSLPLTPLAIKNQSLIKRVYGRDSSFSISTDGSKIIYSKLVNYEQFYKFYDLYLFDLKTEKETRLSEGLRARDPDWSPQPDNPKIVAVINKSGTNNLILINLNSILNQTTSSLTTPYITKEDITYLTDFRDDTQLYQPSWSPKGDMIALSAWCQGHQDIYILNLDSNLNLDPNNNSTFSLWPIFQDQYNDLSPCWSSDSQYLFFSSDRTGIYNIFAFSLPDKKLYQVTNVLGGAFQPALSYDGRKLAFINYHAKGYELHLMEVDSKQWTEIEYINPQIIEEQQVNLHTEQSKNLKNNYPIHPYNSLSSLWPPTYWIPAIQITENDLGIGFSTELEDVLRFYSLPLTITYGIFHNNLNYHLNYYNYRYLPIINLYLSGNAGLTSQTSWWEEGKAGINIYFPFKGQTATTTNSRPYRQIFSLGYQYEKLSSVATATPLDTNQEKITSLRLGYSYSDAEKYGFSISPEQGHSFSLTFEHADKALGGDYTFDKLVFDGRKFIPLPFLHQVLSLRLVAGFSSPNIIDLDLDWEKFKLGGHYSADNLSNIDVETFSLRGYKPALLEGNNLLLTSLEYRFPLANIEHSLKLGPFSIFLERLSGAFFVDIGNAWENKVNDIKWKDFKIGIGGEIKADLNWQLDSPFSLRLGAAKAITDPKGYNIYITLGTSF